MKRKYTIVELKNFSNNREFKLFANDKSEIFPVHVWYNSDSKRAFSCVGCQTALKGMSGSCKHVKALKNFLKIKPVPKVVETIKTDNHQNKEWLISQARLMRRNADLFLKRAIEYEEMLKKLELENANVSH